MAQARLNMMQTQKEQEVAVEIMRQRKGVAKTKEQHRQTPEFHTQGGTNDDID
jgi:hypothetical protein